MDPLSFNLGALSARKRLDEAITPRTAQPQMPQGPLPRPVQAHGQITPGMGLHGNVSAPVGPGNLNLNVGLNGPLAPGGAGFQGAGARYSVPVGNGALGVGGSIGANGSPQNVGVNYDSSAVHGGVNYNIPNGALQASARIPFAEGGEVRMRSEWAPFMPEYQLRRSFKDGAQSFAHGGLAVFRKAR